MYDTRMGHIVMALLIIWIVSLKCITSQSTSSDLNTPTETTHDYEGDHYDKSTSEDLNTPSVTTTNFEGNSYNQESNETHRRQEGKESELHDKHHNSGIHLASWRWDEIGVFFTMTVFIVITGLSKVLFHYAHWLSSLFPESCSLITVGLIVGAILYTSGVTNESKHGSFDMPAFTPRLFFLILLPPVVLEAAYSLYNATFFDNLSTILLYAVVGTIFNTFAIGAILYLLGIWGLMGDLSFGHTEVVTDFTLVQCLVFSTLISAVDPVAVLAIFQEVGVNKDLYFLVFGESLLNDAITVVIYTTMVTFLNMPNIGGEQYTLAVLSFFTVNCGGLIIGVFYGLLTALLTQATGGVRVVEPLAVLGTAYLSYLSAELFHFSGIISIICCGLVQAHYSFKNISQKSYVTVKYFTKMVSATSEAIIFLFLGTVLISSPHEWHTGFAMWTLLLCLVCRFIGVFVLTYLANIFRVKRIGFQEQFIMAYGGLRGAVGFSLVMMLKASLPVRQVFITTTLAVILFTVFIQGATIKPLVKLLNIEVSKKSHHSLVGEVNNQVTSHLMAGIEEIVGFKGNFYIKRKIQDLDEKYLQKIFYKSHFESKIKRVFEKWCLSQHYAHLYGPITLVEDNMADILHEEYDENLKLTDEVHIIPERRSSADDTSRLRRRISEIFPGVEIRKRSTEAETNKEVLRKAFLSNPFNHFYQCYNRNLINDDAQEINSQLKRRRNRARQITRIAFEQDLTPSSQPDTKSKITETFNQTRKKVFSEIEGAPIYEIGGMDNILKRAQRRRTIHLGSTDEFGYGFLRDARENNRLSEEKGSTSQEVSTKEIEMKTMHEVTPLLTEDPDKKSHSSNEESLV